MVRTHWGPPFQAEVRDGICEMLSEHARAMRAPPLATDASARIREWLRGREAPFRGCLASTGDDPVGMALCYDAFASFAAAPILYLEDLFVTEEYRGRGVGGRLFDELRAEAVRMGCCRIVWSVQNWNEDAVRFYERHGAVRAEGRLPYKLEIAP